MGVLTRGQSELALEVIFHVGGFFDDLAEAGVDFGLELHAGGVGLLGLWE